MSSLKKIISSSFLLSSEGILRKMVGLVSTLILARVLLPADFGIIAIAIMVMGLFEALKQFGGNMYLLRAEKVTDDMINTAWTIGLSSTTVFALLLAYSAPFVANYYDDERLTLVLWIYASMWIVQNIGSPGTILLKREQNYFPLVSLSIASKILSVIIAITIALIYENYWALIIGQYSMALTGSIGSYFIVKYRPRLCLKEFKVQWNFSSWWMLQSILGYVKTQLDTFLVSSMYDKGGLGSYHNMKYLSSMPTTFLIAPATEPLIADLAQTKNNHNYFAFKYNVSLLVPLCIAIPFCAFFIPHHELITLILLGSNWVEYSNLFSVFCVSVLTICVQQHAARVFVIHEKTKPLFYFELASFIIIFSLLLGLDIETVFTFALIKITTEAVFSFALFAYITIQYTGFRNFMICLSGIVPIVLSALFSTYTSLLVSTDNPILMQFIYTALIFITTFFVSLIFIAYLFSSKNKEWQYILDLLKKIAATAAEKLNLAH